MEEKKKLSAIGYRGLRTATHTFTIHTTDGKVDKIILFKKRKRQNMKKSNPVLNQRLAEDMLMRSSRLPIRENM